MFHLHGEVPSAPVTVQRQTQSVISYMKIKAIKLDAAKNVTVFTGSLLLASTHSKTLSTYNTTKKSE